MSNVYPHTLRLELRIRQNMQDRAMAEVFDWNPRAPFVAHLRDVQSQRRRFSVALTAVIPVSERWWSAVCQLTMDARPFCEPRAALLFGEVSQHPSLVFFPSMAPESNVEFGGFWTVSFQVIA